MDVTRDHARAGGDSSTEPRISYRERLIGVSQDDGEIRAWVVESDLLGQPLESDLERVLSDDESEEDAEVPIAFEASEAEHP